MRPADVYMRVTHSGLHIAIDGVMDLRRTFWGVESARDPTEEAAGQLEVNASAAGIAPAGGYQAVVPELCSWTIEASGSGTSSKGPGSGTSSSSGNTGGPRRRPPGKMLTLHLALPPPSQEEIMYKKGEREV